MQTLDWTNAEEVRRRIEQGLVINPEAHLVRETSTCIEDRMHLYGVPGLSVAVIRDGKIDWAAGYGEREAGTECPVETDTLFQICSCSKLITALGVLRLAQEGHFGLNDDVNDHLWDWKLVGAGEWRPKITIRQLLSHTAGLPTLNSVGYARDAEIPNLRQILRGEAPAISAPVQVATIPGMCYSYSGGGYAVLQHLVELSTGQPFEVALRTLVLEPLGMRNSTFAQPLPQDLWDRAAAGHHSLARHAAHGKWFAFPEKAATGLWSTASDLALAVIEIQNALQGGPSKFLSREMAREMIQSHARNFRVGLGTFLYNEDDPQAHFFTHAGTHLAWKGMLIGYVNQGLGAVVLTNSGYLGAELYLEVLRAISREYGWSGYVPDPDPETEVRDAGLSGTYMLGNAAFHVAVVNGLLELTPPWQDSPIAFHLHQSGTFRSTEADVVLSPIGGNPNQLVLAQNKLEWTLVKRPF